VKGPSKGMIPSWCCVTRRNQPSGLWLGHVYTQVSMTECRHETRDQGLAIFALSHSKSYIIRCAITVTFENSFIAELSTIIVDSIPIHRHPPLHL
jgi:hypothetical protein